MSNLNVNTISTASGLTSLTTGANTIGFTSGTQTYTLGASSTSTMKNRIINGDMRINQRAGDPYTASSNPYTLDRWQAYGNPPSKYTVQQNAGSVTPPTGFSKYLGVTSSSAYTVASTDYFFLMHKIEGYNVADLAWGTANAQTVTLSFWVRSSLTGTFGGSITQGTTFGTSYPFTYTISSTNTWEQKSVTIPGPTIGSWPTDNTGGIAVAFGLGNGSTVSGTAGSWSNNQYFSTTGTTSVVGTSGATFYLTGVQLEVGSAATNFDFRHYGQELALCQRYFQRRSSEGVGYASFGVGGLISSNVLYQPINLLQTMRVAPSMSSTAANTFRIDPGNVSGTVIAFERITTNGYRINVTTASLTGSNGELHSDYTTLAYIDASAEL